MKILRILLSAIVYSVAFTATTFVLDKQDYYPAPIHPVVAVAVCGAYGPLGAPLCKLGMRPETLAGISTIAMKQKPHAATDGRDTTLVHQSSPKSRATYDCTERPRSKAPCLADTPSAASVITLERPTGSESDTNERTRDEDISLAVAVMFGQATVVEHLIEAGADPNGRARGGETPLMLAVRGNHPEILKALLQHGANANVQLHSDGKTALMLAAERGLADAVRLLLDAGAEVNHRTRDGRTALAAAEAIGNTETAALLRKAGARN